MDPPFVFTPDDAWITPESADYWQSFGLTISDSQIDNLPGAPGPNEKMVTTMEERKLWKNDPILVNGKRRWRIHYSFAWHDVPFFGGVILSDKYQTLIRKMLSYIESEACFTFVEVTTQNDEGLKNLLKLADYQRGGCMSFAGRQSFSLS